MTGGVLAGGWSITTPTLRTAVDGSAKFAPYGRTRINIRVHVRRCTLNLP